MKFSIKTTIQTSREKVVAYFMNTDVMHEWQDGFVSKEELSGIPWKKGATAQLTYKQGGRELILLETILENNLPDVFEALYVHTHTTNTMRSAFREINQNETEYFVEVDYTKLNGFMVKLIAFVYPSMFKKQVQKWIKQFSDFVEKN